MSDERKKAIRQAKRQLLDIHEAVDDMAEPSREMELLGQLAGVVERLASIIEDDGPVKSDPPPVVTTTLGPLDISDGVTLAGVTSQAVYCEVYVDGVLAADAITGQGRNNKRELMLSFSPNIAPGALLRVVSLD